MKLRLALEEIQTCNMMDSDGSKDVAVDVLYTEVPITTEGFKKVVM